MMMCKVNKESFRYSPHSSRLRKYDYRQNGAYFITICTYARICFFGELNGENICLNKYGNIVNKCWQEIPQHFHEFIPAPFIIMPNHVHGIVVISKRTLSTNPAVETRHAVSRASNHICEAFQKPVSHSVPTIIRSFKSAVTRHLNALNENLPMSVWQRNYYEHIIRNDEELNRAIEYIKFNPIKWGMDKENPKNVK